MLMLNNDERSLKIYEALASRPRLTVIELLAKQDMNVKELAERLGFSSATMTMHIKKLEEAGIVVNQSVPARHGHQKICSLALNEFTAQFRSPAAEPEREYYHSSIGVGQYVDYAITPTCGMASRESIIGQMDDPRYFSDPGHLEAAIIWFASGYVEYRIPNYLLTAQRLKSIDITLELCSEAPGFNEQWPSDIAFAINGRHIGTWTCPGDFGHKKGILTPAWWNHGTQYGLLKGLRVTEEGSFLDGIRLSDTTIADLAIMNGRDLPFRIEVSEEARHVGGVVLFGKDFGNYSQNIEVYLNYEHVEK